MCLMRFIHLCTMLGLVIPVMTQAQDYQLERCVVSGPSDLYTLRDMACASDGSLYVAGVYSGTFSLSDHTVVTTEERAIYLAKFTDYATLDLEWLTTIAENSSIPSGPTTVSLDVDLAGNIVVGIGFEDTLQFFGHYVIPDDGSGVVLMSIRMDGALDWWREIEGDGIGKQGIVTDAAEGGILVGGASGGNVFLAKYSSEGNPIWRVTGGGPSPGDDIFTVCTDAEGNVYVVGDLPGSGPCQFGALSFNLPTGCFAAGFLAKYTPAGEPEWVRYVHSQTFAQFSLFNAVVCHGGGIYVAGEYSDALLRFSNGAGTYGPQLAGWPRSFIARYNMDGALDWVRIPPDSDSGSDGVMQLAATEGELHAITSFQGTILRSAGPVISTGGYDVMMERLDSDGGVTGYVQVGGPSIEVGNAIVVHSDHIYLLGASNSQVFENSGTCMASLGTKMFLMQFSDTDVGVEEPIRSSHSFLYPNPASGSFTVHTPPWAERITIADALGRVVYQADMPWAEENVRVDLADIARGMYLVRLDGGKEHWTTKLVVE